MFDSSTQATRRASSRAGDLKRGTMRAIIAQAGLTVEAFLALL